MYICLIAIKIICNTFAVLHLKCLYNNKNNTLQFCFIFIIATIILCSYNNNNNVTTTLTLNNNNNTCVNYFSFTIFKI